MGSIFWAHGAERGDRRQMYRQTFFPLPLVFLVSANSLQRFRGLVIWMLHFGTAGNPGPGLSEGKRLRTAGFPSLWTPACQEGAHVGHAGVGLVSLRGLHCFTLPPPHMSLGSGSGLVGSYGWLYRLVWAGCPCCCSIWVSRGRAEKLAVLSGFFRL